MTSVYADDQGRFGFYNLEANRYHVLIKDQAFNPVDEMADVNPLVSPTTMVQVRLEPRAGATPEMLPQRLGGSNPYMVDPGEYEHRFPKRAVKEFGKALQADQHGRHDDAIRSYRKALESAPDFYPAHNNLGSDYLSKSDFPAARKEFEQVVQLNQSDAAGYFNLSNVCMLMGQLTDAQQFLGEGMRRQPDSPLGHFLLGSLDIRLGKYAEAETALRQAIQLSPTMAQSRLQLVNLLVQQGRKADAVAQLHDFVTAFPENPLTSQAKQLLQRLEPSANVKGPVSN